MDIVTTDNFHATVLAGSFEIVSIPSKLVGRTCGSLLKLLLYGQTQTTEIAVEENHPKAEVFSMVVDSNEVTLFVEVNAFDNTFEDDVEAKITRTHHKWSAIEIHLGSLAAEFPAIVSFLSKCMADNNISIMNMSTFDADIMFVKTCDLDEAIDCLQAKLVHGVHGLLVKRNSIGDNPENKRLSFNHAEANDSDFIIQSLRGYRRLSTELSPGRQYLSVMPGILVMVRLRKDHLRESAYALTELLLFCECSMSNQQAPFWNRRLEHFWCITETDEEISLLMDERCLSQFPQGSVIEAPDRWKAVKLCGRSYGFDETGIVAAMSSINTATPVLNLSTYDSNLAVVLLENFHPALFNLCESLGIDQILGLE